MITKDKVTEIFCVIDEFDKNLDGFLYAIISVPIAILKSIIRIVSAAASTKSSPMRYPIIAL